MKIIYSCFVIITLLLSGVHDSYAARAAVSKSNLTKTAWRLKVTGNVADKPEDVLCFTDSFYSHKVFWLKDGYYMDYKGGLYYLSDKIEKEFDFSKVGKKTKGNYIVTKDDKTGNVSCESLFNDGDDIRIIQSDLTALTYEKCSIDTVLLWESMSDRNVEEFDSFTEAYKKILSVIVEKPGTLSDALVNNSFSTYDSEQGIKMEDVSGLRICGPLNGDDILLLREMFSKQNPMFDNMKILDLSRAWVVSDTVWYDVAEMELTHDQYSEIQGRKTVIELDSVLSDCLGRKGKYEALYSISGVIIEMPDEKGDTTYAKLCTSRLNCIPEKMFAYMKNMEYCFLPRYIEEIGWEAFYGCENLKTVNIPSTCTYVYDCAFEDNKSLKEVRVCENSELLKDGRFKVGDDKGFCFFNCPKELRISTYPLESSFEFRGISETNKIEKKTKELNSLLIELDDVEKKLHKETNPNSIRAIKANREFIKSTLVKKILDCVLVERDKDVALEVIVNFYSCLPMNELMTMLAFADDDVIFHDKCEGIWKRIIWETNPVSLYDMLDCTNFDEKINVEKAGTLSSLKSESEWQKTNKIKITGEINEDDLFFLRDLSYKSEILYSLDISETNVRNMPDSLFAQCTSLYYVALPKKLQQISKFMFYGCMNLQDVTFPDSLKMIDGFAFCYCEKLKEIKLPEGLNKIMYNVFSKCSSMKRIVLPESVDSISFDAFSCCKNLEYLYIPSNIKHIAMNILYNSPNVKVEVGPNNKYCKVVEGQIVGKTNRAKETLNQLVRSEETKIRKSQLVSRYKIVNGKRVYIKSYVKYKE